MTHDPNITVTGRKLTFGPGFRKANPHLFPVGPVAPEKPEPTAPRALDRCGPKRKSGEACVVVSFIRFGRRELDSDNLLGAIKPLRDAIAEWIGIDDADRRVRWQYGQVETRGERGVMVRIETI